MTTPGPAPLTVDDVKDLLFDLYVAQRELARVRAANAALAHQLDVAAGRSGDGGDGGAGQ